MFACCFDGGLSCGAGTMAPVWLRLRMFQLALRTKLASRDQAAYNLANVNGPPHACCFVQEYLELATAQHITCHSGHCCGLRTKCRCAKFFTVWWPRGMGWALTSQRAAAMLIPCVREVDASPAACCLCQPRRDWPLVRAVCSEVDKLLIVTAAGFGRGTRTRLPPGAMLELNGGYDESPADDSDGPAAGRRRRAENRAGVRPSHASAEQLLRMGCSSRSIYLLCSCGWRLALVLSNILETAEVLHLALCRAHR